MELELELEPRVKPLPFKVKAASREAASQKAAHVLDSDLRTHWSTATNTKEWILLELEDPCLLSHIRLYNKSVLEWEITVGLRYKPEAFVKVRPRCEAPRRDMVYPMNYTPCRYVRISCLRGNPIAIFFIQLIGVSIPGLEPEFQPVVNHLLPHIISEKQDSHDFHLQFLQDMASRLLPFLPQLEPDLGSFTDASESGIRFSAMLAGPLYPILQLINEREAAKPLLNPIDLDGHRNNLSSTPTVSSNFEVQSRRSRSPSIAQPASSPIAFRSDAAIILLRKAFKDNHLGAVCREASRVLYSLVVPMTSLDDAVPNSDLTMGSISNERARNEMTVHGHLSDYSSLFGEEFRILERHFDATYLNLLDIAAAEEGILHVLYASAAQPLLCCKLAESNADMWSVLPLVQALLPALRPPANSSTGDQVDDSFWQWKHPPVQQALSQIVKMSTSSAIYHPLLHACAGYLSSYLPSHVKAACVLIDLCYGPLSPWISTITAKVDITIELLEDLLGVIQGTHQSIARSRAALKYIILAVSGHMDNVLNEYKEFKHTLLFLLEMLEPFLVPALTVMKNTISFGGVSVGFSEKQEKTCSIALDIIRAAVKKPAVLPSLEFEWRRGSVPPSVLLSILDPHMPLPPEIDLCKSSMPGIDQASSTFSTGASVFSQTPHISCSTEDIDGTANATEGTLKTDAFEDCTFLFAPPELRQSVLISLPNPLIEDGPDKSKSESSQNFQERKHSDEISSCIFQLDNVFTTEYYNAQADCLLLVNFEDCELRALEFQQLASDLCLQPDLTLEGHNASIDALLLAAECYVNPFFLMSFRSNSKLISEINRMRSTFTQGTDILKLKEDFVRKKMDFSMLSALENKRDKTVLQILLQAAILDSQYQKKASHAETYCEESEEIVQFIGVLEADIQSADAVTLVRKNQALLCCFIIHQFQREEHSSHEILLQSLFFLLHSATELFCPPENVIDIILHSAERLNYQVTSLHNQFKSGNMQLDVEKLHGVRRRWVLLQKLIMASSGIYDGPEHFLKTDSNLLRSLVPPSSWMLRILKFSNSTSPLPRFLGWMAVSRYAKEYSSERLFLASDFSQLTLLLSIFADELALLESVANQKVESANMEASDPQKYLQVKKQFITSDQSVSQRSFQVLHPDLYLFFPSMIKQFHSFGENILEAVGLQLKCLPSSVIPDILCWFSDMCLWPYTENLRVRLSGASNANHLKGYSTVNAKAVVLYILESIVVEHTEAIIPEMSKVVQILVSLCRASYTDVAFLQSVLGILKPLTPFFLRKITEEESLINEVSLHQDFELSCFEELFDIIRCKKDPKDAGADNLQVSLVIFVLGSFLPDLSFKRRIEILELLELCVGLVTSEATSSLYSFLCAFQKVLDNCDMALVECAKSFGISIPLDEKQSSVSARCLGVDHCLQPCSGLTDKADQSVIRSVEPHEGKRSFSYLSGQELHIREFSDALGKFVSQLIPAIEASWNFHYQLAKKLSVSVAKCVLLSKFLYSVSQAGKFDGDGGNASECDSSDPLLKSWVDAMEGLAGVILTTQHRKYWQVASAMLDYLLNLPEKLCLGCILSTICSLMKGFCLHAPRISWRLQTDKWLTLLIDRRVINLKANEPTLVDLFCTMLSHPEPEHRSIALFQLRRIVNMTDDVTVVLESCRLNRSLVESGSSIPSFDSITSALVSSTWDTVVALALYDRSMVLKKDAMALLSEYIPFVEREHLQSFLSSSNTFMQSKGKLSNTTGEGHITRISLVLLASACLHSPVEDIALIPESVWKNLEGMRMSRTGGLADMEKNLCQVLCQLRTQPGNAKTAVKEVLMSSSTVKASDPSLKGIRESILQVLSSLSSVESYFEFFSRSIERESQELEEVEIEVELLQKEKALTEASECLHDLALRTPDTDKKACNRLQQIKDEIHCLERSKLKEEIAARRQKKLLMRHARQKYLEEAALREMELLQELDRQKNIELECEIERQRQLELERGKTRELQFNLDLEREKQAQRELQRELEQVESGIRPSRREFSSNPNSRPRERYRERENGRGGQHEGSLRASSREQESGTTPIATPSISSMPTVVLAGSRSFSGHLPTILQSRDRMDERSSNYEDIAEGSRDSGDASSIGDPELGSAFDGLAGGFGSVPRHGSRGGKSRQVSERRERDGRREGKWERKHS